MARQLRIPGNRRQVKVFIEIHLQPVDDGEEGQLAGVELGGRSTQDLEVLLDPFGAQLQGQIVAGAAGRVDLPRPLDLLKVVADDIRQALATEDAGLVDPLAQGLLVVLLITAQPGG